LRGWLKTDANGRYEINTIKPAPYPGGTEPAHIHAMVKAPNQTEAYWLHDFLFKGDPFLTDTYWYHAEMVSGNLRYEGITLKAGSGSVLQGTRNIVLHPHYDRDGQNSGLLVGENCPAFDPTHVWGPDKGSRTCPMCKYGARTGGVMAWLGDDDWANAGKLALFLEKEIQQRGSQRFKGFLIYTNPKNRPKADVEKQLQAFAEQYHLREVSVVHVPSVDDKKTSFLYSINPRSENTIMVYHRRRVAEKFVNFSATEANLQRILAVVNKTMQ
ncbi:MAG: hypothetical protein LH606_19415, partial [Cytophagaceae bacterium]|nr:hypothetical protein [Cytophagaceae bacterium]